MFRRLGGEWLEGDNQLDRITHVAEPFPWSLSGWLVVVVFPRRRRSVDNSSMGIDMKELELLRRSSFPDIKILVTEITERCRL